jgi:demethylmenaquinone methyltransferase / 2-methoxy-6-polyprenyl-1,4-benzoquinol methylase
MEKRVEKKYPSVKTINEQERISMVKDIFSTITNKYDFLNHLLSARRDIAWRNFAIKKMRFFQTNKFLDVACGTADLAIGTALKHPHIVVNGIDFVAEMVKAGKDKIEKKKLSPRINLMQGDAVHLPFNDNSFDVTGIAFGIRNIPDRLKALNEMLRVTVPGGQVMVLEMTFTQNHFFKFIYHVYLNHILPSLAKLFSSNRAAYYYLAESIMNFPTPDAFAKLMEEAGMVEVEKHALTFGITYLHVGRKPARIVK